MHNTNDQSGGSPIEQQLADLLARHRVELVEHARRSMHGKRLCVEPEDIVQAASLSFFLYMRKRQAGVVESGLLTLMRQCVETAIHDQLKWQHAQKRRAEMLAQPVPTSGVAPAATGTGPETASARKDRSRVRQQALLLAMQELEPADRRILQLRIEDEQYFTFARIGAALGKTEDAVRMSHRRALETMKPALRQLLGDDSVLGG